jgi:predicted GIY-YIG superfamily endonuclease
MTTIYALKLEGGNYYIGKTSNIDVRIEDHLTGDGAAWTRKHRPIAIDKVVHGASPFDEDKITKEYMAKYGIDKVRGGAYVTEELCEEDIDGIQKEIWAATNCCTLCGSNTHYVADCECTSCDEEESDEEECVYVCNYCKKEFEDESDCDFHLRSCKSKPSSRPQVICFRCKKPGHYATNCQQRGPQCFRCKGFGHTVRECENEEEYDSYSESDSGSDDGYYMTPYEKAKKAYKAHKQRIAWGYYY